MNQTPRGLNRFFILVFALLLIVAGVFALALSLWQPFVDWWSNWAPARYQALLHFASSTALSEGSNSWLWTAVSVILVLIIILMIVWVASLGRGRTTVLIRTDDTENADAPGTVAVNGSVAEQLVRHALADRPEIIGSSVTTYALKEGSGLRIKVYPRKGVSPLAVSQLVDEIMNLLDQLIGEPTPALLHIATAARANFVRSERVK